MYISESDCRNWAGRIIGQREGCLTGRRIGKSIGEVWSDRALFICSHRSCVERCFCVLEGNLDYKRMPVTACLLLLPLSVILVFIYPPLSFTLLKHVGCSVLVITEGQASERYVLCTMCAFHSQLSNGFEWECINCDPHVLLNWEICVFVTPRSWGALAARSRHSGDLGGFLQGCVSCVWFAAITWLRQPLIGASNIRLWVSLSTWTGTFSERFIHLLSSPPPDHIPPISPAAYVCPITSGLHINLSFCINVSESLGFDMWL